MDNVNGLRVAGGGASRAFERRTPNSRESHEGAPPTRAPLLRAERAEAHRGRAVSASTPEERFVESYRAARYAAGALLLPRGRKRGPSDVWHRLGDEIPELREWAVAFGGYSTLAAAVEDGLPRTVSPRMADDFLWAVGRFLDLVDQRLGVLGPAA